MAGHTRESAKKAALARGDSYFIDLQVNAFYRMHNRIRDWKLLTDFTRTREGFVDFVVHIGEVPEGMIKPGVGRKDHTKGYVKDNFMWQSFRDNCIENALRNKLGVGTKSEETKQKLSKALKGVSQPHALENYKKTRPTHYRWHKGISFDECTICRKDG